jgi:hypothetical protein
MADTRIAGGNIANCERIKVVTRDQTPRTYVVETMTSLSFAARVSSGAEQELRVKDTIHGTLRTEDILKGYDIQLDDPVLHTQILALVDGGALTGTPGSVGETYTAPAAMSAAQRTAFDLYAYTSDRDDGGEAVAYHEWLFPGCKGRPVEAALKDGAFAAMNYKIESRPAGGQAPLIMRRIAALPDTAG